MYVEHPYKFNDKFYAKVDGKFYEITREVAKAMLSAYRNEVRCEGFTGNAGCQQINGL